MTAVPATILSAIVTILAVLMYFYMGLRVGQMRGKHKIAAPAMTGNPEFERAVRVHMNTLEQIIVFLPLLWVATVYFRTLAWLPAVLGVVWIVGRILYMQGYMQAPEKRELGFGIAALANLGLLILAIVGIAMSWSAATA
jgi:glutathione S-transferase